MRTNGEIEHDAQVRAYLRRIADALDAIAGTLAAIYDGLKPPKFIGKAAEPLTPEEELAATVARQKVEVADDK